MDENHVVGMTVAAVADGEEALFGVGRRDLQSQSPPDGETIYEIGSISKTFTGILLSRKENGCAGLDDPSQRHLPEGITLPESGDASIKLRHLTTHSSGFPRAPIISRTWAASSTLFLAGIPTGTTPRMSFGRQLVKWSSGVSQGQKSNTRILEQLSSVR